MEHGASYACPGRGRELPNKKTGALVGNFEKNP